MKQSEVHSNLPQPEIRDWLAKQLTSLDRRAGSGSVAYLEKKLKEVQAELEAARILVGVKAFMEHKGWQHFDISDDISDYSPETFTGFVGTSKECKAIFPKAAR